MINVLSSDHKRCLLGLCHPFPEQRTSSLLIYILIYTYFLPIYTNYYLFIQNNILSYLLIYTNYFTYINK